MQPAGGRCNAWANGTPSAPPGGGVLLVGRVMREGGALSARRARRRGEVRRYRSPLARVTITIAPQGARSPNWTAASVLLSKAKKYTSRGLIFG